MQGSSTKLKSRIKDVGDKYDFVRRERDSFRLGGTIKRNAKKVEWWNGTDGNLVIPCHRA